MRDFIEPLRAQLLKLGCPITHVRRLVREVAEHREDLKQAGLAGGLSEAEAEARANASLGDPLAVAEQMMETVRRSSWWGRHYVVTFGLLPVLAYPVIWLLFLALEFLLVSGLGFGFDAKKLHAAGGNPYFAAAVQYMDCLAIALATFLFCWLARHVAVKLKWMAICCAICSMIAVITYTRLDPDTHIFSLGFGLGTSIYSFLHMPWYRGMIPLLAAGAAYAFQQRAARRFGQRVAASADT